MNDLTPLSRLAVHNQDKLWDSPTANLTWPVTLPVELALRQSTPEELRLEYGYSSEQWEALRYHPVFLADLTHACEMVKKEGASFRMKAGLMSDTLLETAWKMVHAGNDEVAPPVKADLIKSVVRWAGLDIKAADTGGGPGGGLNIQINL